jgi:hypothetical protein
VRPVQPFLVTLTRSLMLRTVNWPTLVSGLLLATISLTFAATGLVHLFAGAGLSIVVMAVAFEVAKVGTTIYLIQNFRLRFVPLALTFALLCLVVISALGIYGYLGRAYAEGRADAVTGAGAIAVIQTQVTALEQDRERLLAQVEAIPAEHSTNRRRVLTEIQPRLDGIATDLNARRDELATLQRAQVGKENSIGELRYAAELVGTDEEGIAKFVITVLALLLDPLAVLLILASGIKGQREEKAEVEHALPPTTHEDASTPAFVGESEQAGWSFDPPAENGQEPGYTEEPASDLSPALCSVLRAVKDGKPKRVGSKRRRQPNKGNYA